jgi:hypothetical protein
VVLISKAGAMADGRDETPTKEAVYRLRGEALSVGGAVEWRIHHLAKLFASSNQMDTTRQWTDLKRSLRSRGLTPASQAEMAAIADYFTARNSAAHSYEDRHPRSDQGAAAEPPADP